MIAGVAGSLLSHDALERIIPSALRGHLGEADRTNSHRQFRAWYRTVLATLGPSASARGVFDRVAAPLVRQLGYQVVPLASSTDSYTALLRAGGVPIAVLLVTAWGQDLAATWRDAVRRGIGTGARWCLSVSGPRLRLADSERAYSRRFVECDLAVAAEQEASFAVLWGLLRAGALMPRDADAPSVLHRAIAISEQHRLSVRQSLQAGVEEALSTLTRAFAQAAARRGASGRQSTPVCVNESLIVIYRILFLLFAEARSLVPRWHPVFRDSYTIESLRHEIEKLENPPGLWESLQAISRLAHRGCRAATLRVPAFNGPLFSPAHAPLADALRLDDGVVGQAVQALTTRPVRTGAAAREQIAYSDLGVEQLGAVYERLLDFRLPDETGPPPEKRERRKATGSFYTPRSLTEYLVRRTLAPLVAGAAPDRILALRIVDPAMGSGAFLVAACRYLASAYEQALVQNGDATAADFSAADRAGFRRTVAQRCLYGVDVNPMAVQLGRLSIWLATLAADKPLTFLDHRLRPGDSLVGASTWDVLRQPPPGGRTRTRLAPLPLFDTASLDATIGSAVAVRLELALGPADTLAQVRAKELALARLHTDDSAARRWKRLADIWCAGWFTSGRERPEMKTLFPELKDTVLTGRAAMPGAVLDRLLTGCEAIAQERRFFHWTFEFPEVFYDAGGHPLQEPGFDALIGNPPWEMLRGDHGDAGTRAGTRLSVSHVADFVRGSGVYHVQGDGHVNLYQLFVERALSLVRHGGRLGLILPSGFATDHGCASLRQALFDRARVDTFDGFENRDALFPIHRGLKFLLVTASAGERTTEIPARFGLRHAELLDRRPDAGIAADSVALNRLFLDRLSGSQLVVPEIRSAEDREIVSAIAFGVPALSETAGWHVTFGRELNATDDKRHFVEGGAGLPVLDGKNIQPFAADVGTARYRVPEAVAERLAGRRAFHRRPRLAYRDVASATNRLTLISAIVPAGVLTTHTLFCLKEDIDEDVQLFLSGMLNSFVANYLVRLQVSTHVTASLMSRLPVPRPSRTDALFATVSTGARRLRWSPADAPTHAIVQAAAARLYGVRRDQLSHILSTFPLVDAGERAAVISAFDVGG